jgi:hypothetical protein
MSSMIPKIGHVFQYGFLASNVSRVIAIYNTKKDLTKENKELLRRGTRYIDDILSSQSLVSGEKGNMAPSINGLRAFKHAINSMPKVNKQAVNSPGKRKILFERIKNALDGMISQPITEPKKEDLILADSFFGVVADIYLNEIDKDFRVESSMRPE